MSVATLEVPKIIRKKQKFGEEEIEVAYRKAAPHEPIDAPLARPVAKGQLPCYCVNGWGNWPPLNPRTYEIGNGIICEQDVAVPMRDGAITYCDIYRPANQKDIPVVIAWSFYGKRPCADSDNGVADAGRSLWLPFQALQVRRSRP